MRGWKTCAPRLEVDPRHFYRRGDSAAGKGSLSGDKLSHGKLVERLAELADGLDGASKRRIRALRQVSRKSVTQETVPFAEPFFVANKTDQTEARKQERNRHGNKREGDCGAAGGRDRLLERTLNWLEERQGDSVRRG